MFLLNSRYPLFCATLAWLPKLRHPFSRSYGVNLPSSFNTILSSALVYSTRPPVSVWGTVICQSYFLEALHCTLESNYRVQLTNFVTSGWLRNINLIPIDYSFRSRLRGRLTLRGLTLRRKPWTYGEHVFHMLYRYLCQHSHF